MPGFNQRGPMGDGTMTGRRMGRCTNFGTNAENQSESQSNSSSNQNLNRGIGCSCGVGKGMGRGRQNRFRGGQ
mgnify:CR=1 FL=1